MSRDYRWCSAHQQGHSLDAEPCPAWLDALAVREAVLAQRRYEWRRARNRAGRWRRCLVCSRRFDAGAERKRGRPQELCSAACQEIRDNELRRLRHAGIRTRPRKSGARPRWHLRMSPEVVAFLDYFPDGGYVVKEHPDD